MKTKITAVAVVLAVAMATVVAANLSGSARTIPMPTQGDPLPGIDISIEQSPSGQKIGQGKTNAKGIAEFKDVPAGKIFVRVVDSTPGTSSNYNSSRSNTAGLTIGDKAAGTIIFSRNKPGELSVEVPRPGPWTIKVTAKEGPDPKRN